MTYFLSCYYLCLGLASAYLGISAIVQRRELNQTSRSFKSLKGGRSERSQPYKSERGSAASRSWLVSVVLMAVVACAVFVDSVIAMEKRDASIVVSSK